MQRLLGHKFYIYAVVTYTLFLTAGSLINLNDLPQPPSNFDKVVHVGGYFGLALLWMLWELFRKPFRDKTIVIKRLLVVSFMVIIYGIFIEFLQGILTTYRTADGWDIVANTLGVLLALGVALLLITQTTLLKTKF